MSINGVLFRLMFLTSVILLYESAKSQPKCEDDKFSLRFFNPSNLPNSTPKEQTQLTAFSVCFWIKTKSSFNNVVFFYQTTNGQDVSLSITTSHVNVAIGNAKRLLKPQETQLTSSLLSLCLTWSNSEGECKLYINSALVSKVTGFSKNVIIDPGGKLYLGRPSSVSIDHIHISHFNMWSYVLPTQVIAVLGQRCNAERGDVVSWNMFKNSAAADVAVLQDICPNQVLGWNLTGPDHHHWSLNGPHEDVSLQYSAVYIEGRFNGSKSLFLDSTRAHAIIKPAITLANSFTIAFWMKYTSFDSRNATVLHNDKEFVLKILNNKLVFQRYEAGSHILKNIISKVEIDKNVWQHVALVWYQDAGSYQIRLYVDGLTRFNSTTAISNSWRQSSSSTWDLGGTYDSWKYGYFLGFLSELIVFTRSLTTHEIGSLMAVGSTSSKTSWQPPFPSAANPAPSQTSLETWPDISSCMNIRPYQPVDCIGALLVGKNYVNFTYEDDTVRLPCDHTVNGGGWLVIGTRSNSPADFQRQIASYIEGFWEDNNQFWLGSNSVSKVTKQPTQLLVETQDTKEKLTYTSCALFKMNIEKKNTIHTSTCLGNAAGDAGFESLDDIKKVFVNSSLTKVAMKIRPVKDIPTDYTLLFQPSRTTNDYVRVHNLTELPSFTICLWVKVLLQHDGTFFSLVSHSSSCFLFITSDPSTGYNLEVKCTDTSAKVSLNIFDDMWHHVCVTWDGSTSHVQIFIDGKKKVEHITNKHHVFHKGGFLNIGRYQDTFQDSSINRHKDFIGQLGHVNVWSVVKNESIITILAEGPGPEFGDVMNWALVRAWLSGGLINVLHPSSCLLKENYRWSFKSSNNSRVQSDDRQNLTAYMTGGNIESDETLVISNEGSITASDDSIPYLGLSMSFWTKQQVIISNILGDNLAYHNQLKAWLSPLVFYHASWVRCYSSRQHGWFLSKFHSMCDFKGPTITLIRVEDLVFGGMIDQSWGGSSGFLPSETAFLFTLRNPHNIAPKKFNIKTEFVEAAAYTNQFVGPSFGSNDLVVYEDGNGRVICWSNLGRSYNVSQITVKDDIFAGSRWFYPDEIEVFYYDFPIAPIKSNLIYPSSIEQTPKMYCAVSGSSGAGYLFIKLEKLERITHIELKGDSSQGYVTAFRVEFHTAYDADLKQWKNVTKDFVDRREGQESMHVLLPPIAAKEVKITPTKWFKKLCLNVTLYTVQQACGEPFGMDYKEKLIPDRQITASSSYSTYKYESNQPEIRWPHSGRLNNDKGSWGWHPDTNVDRKSATDWFQVDIGKTSDIRCIALQGRAIKKQFVKELKFGYSMDGANWDFSETNYKTTTFKQLTDSKREYITVLPRAVTARFVRLYPVKCSVFCALRTEFYGNQSDPNILPDGLQFLAHQGSNAMVYSTLTNSWKIKNKPQLTEWTHVTLTFMQTNGIKVYFNGSLIASSQAHSQRGFADQPTKVAITMAGGVGTTPMKLAALKLWQRELEQKYVLRDYETIKCDFEQDTCLDTFQLQSQVGVSWRRVAHCLSSNSIGQCVGGSLTGYCLALKSSPLSYGQTSYFITTLIQRPISCISFNFRIYGNDTGRLNIYLIDYDGEKSLLWRRGGNHGKAWKDGSIPIIQSHPFKIEFEGILGREVGGYISIDNISLSVHPCPLKPGNAASSCLVVKTNIFPHVPVYMQNLKGILSAQNLQKTSWMPCYRSREHGWNVSTFENLCKNKGPTLLLARKRESLFGGYTKESWRQDTKTFSLEFGSLAGSPAGFAVLQLQQEITSFSVSLWMQTSLQNKMTLLSVSDEFYIDYDSSSPPGGHLKITLFSSDLSITENLHDNVWHHIFVQWENKAGNCSVFVDGNFKTQKISSVGKRLLDGSPVAIGKMLSNIKYFQGKLDSVNVWSNTFDHGVRQLLSQRCQSYSGNAVAWREFEKNIYGNVKVVASTCLTIHKGNVDYDLHFSPAPGASGHVVQNSTWKNPLTQFTISWWMKASGLQDMHVLTYMVTEICAHTINLNFGFEWNTTSTKWMFVIGFNKYCGSNKLQVERLQILAAINDEYWHHVVVTWSSNDVFLYIDGLLERSINFSISNFALTNIPSGGKMILAQTPQNKNISGDLNSKHVFLGKLTDFNMWDYVLSQDALTLLAYTCGSNQGNLLSWGNARNHLRGKVEIYEPSSCPKGDYRPDSSAFLFVLNDTLNNSTFAKVRNTHVEVATRDLTSRGLVYGESPHDLIVGINDIMSTAEYHRNISYASLDQLPSGRFIIDDLEVHYKKESLCDKECPYHYMCDEVNGRCKCITADTSFGLCTLDYNATYFWPLDHPNDVKNLRGRLWGIATSKVISEHGINGPALKTIRDPQSEITLERFDTSCLEESKPCEVSISLWLKYWLIGSERNQTFLDIDGLVTLYQPNGTSKLLAVTIHRRRNDTFTNIFSSPPGIWSYYTIIIHQREGVTYRNGEAITKLKTYNTEIFKGNSLHHGLIVLGRGGALAAYDDLMLSNTAIVEKSHIDDHLQYYTVQTIIPVMFSVRFPQETWHDDLSQADNEIYLDLVNRIKSNITSFYGSQSSSVYGINNLTFRKDAGSVLGNFSISYYPWSSHLVSTMMSNISSTSSIFQLRVQDVQVEPSLVPNPPLDVQAYKLQQSVFVKWSPPKMDAITSSYLQGYNVYYQKQNDLFATKIPIEGIEKEATLTDITPFLSVKIWVAAYTIKGEGLPSKEVFLTNSTLPSVTPNNTACNNLSSSSIFVTWDKTNISGLQGYEAIIYKNSSQEKQYSMLSSCGNITFRDLEPFTAYGIKVAVLTNEGRGPYTSPVICRTGEEAPSGSPSNLIVVGKNSTQLEISWQPIPLSQRNGIIQHYVIVYFLLDENGIKLSNGSTSSTSLFVKLVNLKPYSNYRIEISGYNSKGTGPHQNQSFTVITGQAAPSAFPVLDTASNQSSTSILVKWQPIPKSALNGILQYYKVHYQDINSPTPQYKNVLENGTNARRKRRSLFSNPQVLLDGLKKYTLYRIKVAGVTVAQGPYSPVINVTTDQDIPGPPSNLKAVNKSSTSIQVSWQLPAEPNGIVLHYKIFYREEGQSSNLGSQVLTKTSGLISGLVNYTTYDIRVAAYTIKGKGNESRTTCTTDEGVPTGPPEKVYALPASPTSIEVKWQSVPVIQRRGIITQYQVVLYNLTDKIVQRTVTGNRYSTIIEKLERQSNYSVKVRAYTRIGPGPFSNLVKTTTHSEVPKSLPANVTAVLNGTNSIQVKWSGLSQHGIRGYIITYAGLKHPFASERNTTVDQWIHQHVLKNLFYYTRYSIKVAAYSTQIGNYSQPVYVTTGESVPTKPPSMGVVSSRGSTSASVFWNEIPDGYRNGRVVEYQVDYRKAGSVDAYKTMYTDQFSVILEGLDKNADYEVKIAGSTSAGYGNSSLHFVTTDEDVPSETPQNLTAHNRTSLTTLPVTWQPVPLEHIHGELTGYHLIYSIVQQGDKDVLQTSIHEVAMPANATSYTITNLLPLSVYRVSVTASTKKGAGPLAITFGETCRCTSTLTTSWRQYIPYANITNDIPGLIIPVLVHGMTSYCCGYCREYGYSKVDFARDGKGSPAEKTSLEKLLLTIDGNTDFSFPVYGYQDQITYKGGLGYTPLIMSPGVAFIVYKQDNIKYRENMFNAIVSCWPVLVIPIVMCYIAGFIVWVLDSTVNAKHYPRSFIKGVQNGIWWSFVSMTTVGYGDKTPKSYSSRIFAVLWTLCGIVIISVCTSTLTTSLTEVTIQQQQNLYGAQVAAIQNSPEFHLGKRRNAHVNEKKQYHTIEDMIKALHEREVDGILVDTYAAGSRINLFKHPSLIIAKVLDYKMAYGLVTAGHAIQIRRCFQDYLNVFKVDIFNNISNNVRKITIEPEPAEKIITDGLFNTKSEQFKGSIKYTGMGLVSLIIVGVCFDWIRKLRSRAPIQSQEALKDLSSKRESMKELVVEFKHKMSTISQDLIKKHKIELSRLLRLKRRTKTKQIRNDHSFVAGRDFMMHNLKDQTPATSTTKLN